MASCASASPLWMSSACSTEGISSSPIITSVGVDTSPSRERNLVLDAAIRAALGELLGLRRMDVDLAARTIKVQRIIGQMTDGRLVIRGPSCCGAGDENRTRMTSLEDAPGASLTRLLSLGTREVVTATYRE
jgi:hypothetical protein